MIVACWQTSDLVFQYRKHGSAFLYFLFLFSSWCFHSTSIIKMINIILLLLYLRRFPDYYSLQYDN